MSLYKHKRMWAEERERSQVEEEVQQILLLQFHQQSILNSNMWSGPGYIKQEQPFVDPMWSSFTQQAKGEEEDMAIDLSSKASCSFPCFSPAPGTAGEARLPKTKCGM